LEDAVCKVPERRDYKASECSGFKVLIDVVSEILESGDHKIPFGEVFKIPESRCYKTPEGSVCKIPMDVVCKMVAGVE